MRAFFAYFLYCIAPGKVIEYPVCAQTVFHILASPRNLHHCFGSILYLKPVPQGRSHFSKARKGGITWQKMQQKT